MTRHPQWVDRRTEVSLDEATSVRVSHRRHFSTAIQLSHWFPNRNLAKPKILVKNSQAVAKVNIFKAARNVLEARHDQFSGFCGLFPEVNRGLIAQRRR